MKTGIKLITEERVKGYHNLKAKNFKDDFNIINKGVQFAYDTNSKLKHELLVKAGALIAAEIDRLQSTPIKIN